MNNKRVCFDLNHSTVSSERLAILQPVMIPELHDLAVMKYVDLIILDDNAIWSRKGRVHRAKIRTPDGIQYIHIPIHSDDRKKPLHQVRIDHSENWIHQILRSLEYNYRNSIYYDFYEPEIIADFKSGSGYEYLLPFVLFLRKRLFQFLNLEFNAEFVFASDMANFDPDPDQLSLNLNVKQYFQEPESRHYQRQGTGKRRVELQFKHPVYRQHFEDFEPGCCLLDLLFQYGPESYLILEKITEQRA